MTSPAPRPVSERIDAIDSARGVAILAVVFVNVIAMAGPQSGMVNPHVLGPAPWWDMGVFWGVRIFVEGKFISIFCLLFGIGMALQTTRLEASGRSGRIYLRRQVLLGVMGVLHGVLFWWGDILFAYSVLGLVSYVFRKQKIEALRVVAWLSIGIGVLSQSASLLTLAALPADAFAQFDSALSKVTIPEGFPPWVTTAFEQPDPFAVLTTIEVGCFQQGPWPYSLGLRALLFVGTAIGSLAGGGFWLVGLMILGIGLAQDGFLEAGAWQRRRQWMLRGAVLGLTIELLGHGLAIWGGHDLFNPRTVFGEALRQVGKPPLALAFFAALVSASHSMPGLMRPFIATGRMALTNYIGQSVVMAVLMMHWGFGWYGTLGRFETLGVVLVLVSSQVVLSHVWLRFFDQGPLEWAWRRLTYMR